MTHATDRAQFIHTAATLELSFSDTQTILRAAQTLHTWAVHACNGTIQREKDTGKFYSYNAHTGKRLGPIADRETGALKRLTAVCARNGIGLEYQGDPRGYVVKLLIDGREYGVPSRG